MTSQITDAEIGAIANTCLAVRLRVLNRAVTSLYEEALRPFGLKVTQMNILVVAAKMGLARPADICAVLQMDASTLSRTVDRMRAKGWLEIVAVRDRRAQPFRVLPAGRMLLKQALPAWESAQEKAMEYLGQAGVELLQRSVQMPTE